MELLPLDASNPVHQTMGLPMESWGKEPVFLRCILSCLY